MKISDHSGLHDRALELKRQNVSPKDGGEKLTLEFKERYPDWPIKSVADFVKRTYAE